MSTSQHGDDPRVVFFDATQRRRDRLREHHAESARPVPKRAKAAQSPPIAADVPKPELAPAAPHVRRPTPQAAQPAMPAAHTNGHAPKSQKAAAPPLVAARPAPAASLEKFLVDFVVEQTGYPPEIVELDADLEADLGIDSIKKAQLFGELGERFDLRPSDDLRLDGFPTLRHVLDYLVRETSAGHANEQATRSVANAPPPREVDAPVAPAPTAAVGDLEAFLVSFVVEQTGYPPEIVELDADLEADLGIDSIKKAQLFGELGERFDLRPNDDLRLDGFPTLRHVLDYLAREVAGGATARTGSEATRAAEPPSAEATSPTRSANGAELERFLVTFVVEQTGYPPEIVELDADLEADLGIDSIKKAQLFGELGERFDLQPSDDLRLDGFPTLRHVLGYLVRETSRRGGPAATVAGATTNSADLAAGSAESAVDTAELERFLVDFVVEQTGYPPEIVELDADLEADLGIDSIKKAQLFGELGERFQLQPAEDMRLDAFPTLRHVLEYLAAETSQTSHARR